MSDVANMSLEFAPFGRWDTPAARPSAPRQPDTQGARQVLMRRIAPTEKAAASGALEKRLWHAADQFGVPFHAHLFR